MKYAVEIHRKYTENTHGDLVNVLGIFDTEEEAWKCLYKHRPSIKNNEIIDIYIYADNTEDVKDDFVANKKKEIYDELCRVLTDWETQEAVDDDLYWMLVKIQNNWEAIITAEC